MSTPELLDGHVDGSRPVPRSVCDTAPPRGVTRACPSSSSASSPNNQTAGPELALQTGHEHGGIDSMPEAPTLTPERVLTLIEGGCVIVDPDGPAMILPLTDPGLHRDIECGCDPSGTHGHVCLDMYNQPIRSGTPCHIWARQQLRAERTPQPWHANQPLDAA